MKQRLLLIAGALLVLVPCYITLAQEEVAAQAAAAYQAGDYDTAIRLYEALVAGGAQDGAVFYNLGAAYYGSGDFGKALVNYLRTQTFTPRDGDLNTNIALIRARRLDVQGDEAGLFESLSVLTSGILTLTELAWIAFAVWVLWFGLFSAAILQSRLREILRAPLLIIGVLTVISLLLLGSRLYVTASASSAVVIESTVQAMSGPGGEYLEIFQLHEAAELRVLDSRDDWIRVSLPDGRQGWIPREAVETV